MISIRQVFVLLLVGHAAHGRYLEWSTSTDQQLIRDALQKSVDYLSLEQDADASVSDAKNVLCQTHLINGRQIKLTFDLGPKRWECELYQSPVESLGISHKSCTDIGDAASDTDDESPENDGDAKIDELSERRDDGEETDDETGLDDEETGDNKEKDGLDEAAMGDNNAEKTESEPDVDKTVPEEKTENDGDGDAQGPSDDSYQDNDQSDKDDYKNN